MKSILFKIHHYLPIICKDFINVINNFCFVKLAASFMKCCYCIYYTYLLVSDKSWDNNKAIISVKK